VATPVLREAAIVEPGKFLILEEQPAGGWLIKTTDNVEQRRLSAADGLSITTTSPE